MKKTIDIGARALRAQGLAAALRAQGLAAALALATLAAWAAPGAHGPDGEHLDAAPPALAAAAAHPRLEAQSDLYELVAELRPGQLVIYLDRYASNEPVTDARIEVALGERRALAQPRAAQADHVVDDAALLAALAAPGEHGLVFTLAAGDGADLLSAVLRVPAAGAAGPPPDPGRGEASRWALVAAGALLLAAALGALAGVAAQRHRQRRRGAGTEARRA
jgi:hypothetical protein